MKDCNYHMIWQQTLLLVMQNECGSNAWKYGQMIMDEWTRKHSEIDLMINI